MKLVDAAVSRLGTAGDVVAYLWRRKLWWLAPFVILLLIFGALLLLASTTGIAPFIYTMF